MKVADHGIAMTRIYLESIYCQYIEWTIRVIEALMVTQGRNTESLSVRRVRIDDASGEEFVGTGS